MNAFRTSNPDERRISRRVTEAAEFRELSEDFSPQKCAKGAEKSDRSFPFGTFAPFRGQFCLLGVVAFAMIAAALFIGRAVLAQPADAANLSSTTAETPETVDPAPAAVADQPPDISGVWKAPNVSSNLYDYVYRAPAGSAYQFLSSSLNRRDHRVQLTWLPEHKLFEVTEDRGRSQRKSYWLPRLNQKKILAYRLRPEIAGALNPILEQIARSDTDLRQNRNIVQDELSYVAPYGKLEGDTLILTEDDESLAAFNRKLGRWDRIRVPPPRDGSPRLLHAVEGAVYVAEGAYRGGLTVVVVDDQLLVYTSETGRWSRATIPAEFAGKVTPVFDGNLLTAQAGGVLYVFSTATSQWMSSDGKSLGTSDPDAAEEDTGERQIKVFTLANASAEEIARLIKELFPGVNVVSDPRTNAVTVVSPNVQELGEIEAIVLRHDESPTRSTLDTPARRPGAQTPSPAAQRLADEIARHEAEAVELAKQIRNQKAQYGDKHPKQTEARIKMENALAAALELKFQLEATQVEELRGRLTRLEEQIGRRKSLRQQIIDRRAQELIEGDATNWESEAAKSLPQPSAAATAQEPAEEPISLNNPVPSEPAAAAPSEPPADLPIAQAAPPDEPRSDSAESPIFSGSYQSLIAAFQDATDELESAQGDLKIKEKMHQKGYVNAENLLKAQQRSRRANRKHQALQDEYAALIRDLRLQDSVAELAYRDAEVDVERVQQLHKQSVATESELREALSRRDQAGLALQRVRNRLELFQKIDGDALRPDINRTHYDETGRKPAGAADEK